jgi:DnaJ-class molecular chaperone
MTPDEIDAEWERETFGIADKDREKVNKDEDDYVKFLNDFLTGRGTFDKMPAKKTVSSQITSAFAVFNLPITASWREVGAKYRALAKKYHPDTAKNKSDTSEFTRINTAYETLKKYFKK